MLDQGALDDEAKRRGFRAILKSYGDQTERIGNIATKLRLTAQSRYFPDKARLKAVGVQLWNDWGN